MINFFDIKTKNIKALKICSLGILEETDEYLKQKKLAMNTEKTELFSFSRKNDNFGEVNFNREQIEAKEHHIYTMVPKSYVQHDFCF